MIEALSEQLITIDELRAKMPHLRAREQNLRSQIDALDAQAADRDAYLKLADDIDGFLARLRGSTATRQHTAESDTEGDHAPGYPLRWRRERPGNGTNTSPNSSTSHPALISAEGSPGASRQ